MNKLLVCIFCVGVLLLTVAGCGKPKPEGFPSLEKVTLIVQQDGAPLAGASVSLFSDDKSIKWSVGGISNDRGEVTVKTHGQYPGAPQGKYVVTVVKAEYTKSSLPENAPLDADAYAEWQKQRDEEKLPVYDLVDPTLKDRQTSKLEITVSKGSNSETLDCGKAIRQERK